MREAHDFTAGHEYRVNRRVAIRVSLELGSAAVAEFQRNDVFVALQVEALADANGSAGNVQVRCDKGWVSSHTNRRNPCLIDEAVLQRLASTRIQAGLGS